MRKKGMTPKKAAVLWKPSTKLKAARVKRNFSQKDLASKAGINHRTLQHYEAQTSNVDRASLETLCDLSLALNCGIEDIIESEELVRKYKATQSKGRS